LVLGIAGVVLGAAGLVAGVAARKSVKTVDGRISQQQDTFQQYDGQLRNLAMQTQAGFDRLQRDMRAMNDEILLQNEKLAGLTTPKKVEPAAAPAGSAPAATAAAPVAGGVYHTVASGDLLGRIAKKYGVTADAIRQLNPGLNPDRVQIGQKIRVK